MGVQGQIASVTGISLAVELSMFLAQFVPLLGVILSDLGRDDLQQTANHPT